MIKQTLIPFHVFEDVALAVSYSKLECESGVVTLQDGCVVVQNRQLTPRIAQE